MLSHHLCNLLLEDLKPDRDNTFCDIVDFICIPVVLSHLDCRNRRLKMVQETAALILVDIADRDTS
jgi:hypothetical protein